MTGIATIAIVKLVLAAVVSAAAVTEDLRHRRIPNMLCAILLFTGIGSGGFSRGWTGVTDSLLGATLGCVVFLLPYGLGGMGGGDVKLMSGFGSLTGVQGVLPALFLVAVGGALTSILYLGFQRLRGQSIAQTIPYAPAIVTGSLLVAFSQIGVQ